MGSGGHAVRHHWISGCNVKKTDLFYYFIITSGGGAETINSPLNYGPAYESPIC